MSDLKIDEDTGDLDVSGIDLQNTSGREAIEQHLRQRIQTFAGEYFLDSRVGVPYFQHILKKNPDPIIVDSAFKIVIINTPGVIELLTFALDLDTSTRELTLTFRASTSDGVIDFTEVVPNV